MKLLTLIKKTRINKHISFDYNNISLKHFPSSTRSWDNSIFLYNKNNMTLIYFMSNLCMKLIKSYFLLYNKKLEKKLRRKAIFNRIRKISTNKIFVSKGEFKHTNNKVIITLYVYNKLRDNFLIKLKKRFIKKLFSKQVSLKKNSSFLNEKISNRLVLLNKFNKINHNGLKSLINTNTFFRPKIAKILKNYYEKKSVNKYLAISKYVNRFYKKLIKKSLKRLYIYIFYKKLIYLNKSKFNYTYLQFMSKKMWALFSKNIEFNFINLKYFYLNSNILSESILLKIRKNRRKLRKHLINVKKKVVIKKKKTIMSINIFKKNKSLSTRYLYNNYLFYKHIINKLKYKHITGFRLETKGRLNRRYKASRSMSKVVYNGNLLNIDSSYRTLSSVLLRNNISSNLQYTKLNSKTRIGSFGIKGWVSGN
jgi:hypothetical protein